MITFVPSDYKYPSLESLASDIAEIVHSRRGTIVDLNEMLSRTGEISVFKTFFPKWKVIYLGRTPASDRVQFVDILEKIPCVCMNKQCLWEKLRGIIAEKIYEKHFTEIHQKSNVDFGVIVAINSNKVIYSAPKTDDGDGPRRTVDAGCWDGSYGEFVEVKLRPDRYERKDLKYLELLEQELDKESIDHKICLVSFEDIYMLEKYLTKKGLIDKDCNFQLISHEDFLPI